eukprot:453297_1
MTIMTSLCWKTIPTHDFLAVHGYIHSSIDLSSLYIPNDIINYIVIWYYDVSIWKIENEKLTHFFSLKNSESIYSKPFKINGITFHLSLCPNGWKNSQHGFVQYYLEIKELEKNISSFTVYFEFYCYETKSSWKGIRILSKINDAVGWYHYTLSLKQCKKIVNKLNTKCLTFGCCIEVLNINYHLIRSTDSDETETETETEIETVNNNSNIRSIQYKHIKLNRYIQKTWVLNKYPLTRFKHCVYPKNFHSPSFENNYWCFECQANFEHNMMIYCRLKLIRMPYNIKNMKIKCQLQTNMKCETNKNENGMNKIIDKCDWEIVDLNFKHNYTKWKAYLTYNNNNNNKNISIKIDTNKLIKMSLCHDIIESICGDIVPIEKISGISKDKKHEIELNAMIKIRDEYLKGTNVGKEMYNLWIEFEEGKTTEAKIVKDLDKLDMIIQANEYENDNKNNGINLNEFFDGTRGIFKTEIGKALDKQLINQRQKKQIRYTK